MRKLLVTIVSVFLLSAGAAFAQDEDTIDVAPDGDTWVGVSSGYPLGLTAHYGLGDALGDGVDLRFNGRFTFASAVTATAFGFNVGADALFAIPIDADDLSVYAGAGPNLGFVSATTVSGASAGGVSIGAQALVGTEYDISDDIGVFGEFRLGFAYVTSLNFAADPTFAFGANYHF